MDSSDDTQMLQVTQVHDDMEEQASILPMEPSTTLCSHSSGRLASLPYEIRMQIYGYLMPNTFHHPQHGVMYK